MGARDGNQEWERLGRVLPDFDSWLDTHDGRYHFVRWIYTGRSGSLVGVVTRHESPDPPQQLVMRISADDIGEDAAALEVRRVRKAWRQSGDGFRKSHLAAMEGEAIPLAGRYLTFQRVAGGDLTTYRPLAERVESNNFADTCANVTASIVDDWNPDFPHQPKIQTPARFLRKLLGNKWNPLVQWAAKVGINPGIQEVRSTQDSRLLPNPLMLAANDGMAGSRTLPIIQGRAHGDLNVHNILLPKKWDQYQLVDLGGFRASAPLARDPMHLLLSVAARWIATVDQGVVGRDLAEAIVPIRNHRTPERVGRFGKVSRMLHHALEEQARARGYGDLWAEQSLLALIAAALRFAGREVPNTDAEAARRWFFYLAAVATSEFLDRWHADENQSASHSNVFPIWVRLDPAQAPVARVHDDVSLFLRNLGDELSRRAPDPESESSMVISTYALSQLLAKIPAVRPTSNADILALAEDLRRVLVAAVRPGATYGDREHAVKIHGWLRESLANPR